MDPDFGELKIVPVREVWRHEAHHFTRWLAENISRLGEAIGMDLEVVKVECEVGSFSLDILAKDLGSGRTVVIENQYSSTNHDHLGKLLTYAAGHDAVAAIWIAESVRDEHQAALEWLNRHTDIDTHFFAVTVEVFQIDNSRRAFEFRPVVLPNEWQQRTRAAIEGETSPRGEAYRAFFQVLINELREKYKFTNARAAQPQSWYSFSMGISGVTLGASFAKGGRARIDVYVNQGDAGLNKALFDRLLVRKSELEAEFGEPLEWERLDQKQASRIAVYRPGSIDQNDEALGAIRSWMVDKLLRSKEIFGWAVQQEMATDQREAD